MSNIRPEDIKNFRAARKAAGLTGCITGMPNPAMDFLGYRDIQSWRPVDPMNPHCFCFDCRDLWDPEGLIDLKLIQMGHPSAVWTYAAILPVQHVPAPVAPIPVRTTGGGAGFSNDKNAPPPLNLSKVKRDDKALEERCKTDLGELRGKLQSELITVMDKRRRMTCLTSEDRTNYLNELSQQETALWRKLDAIDVLLN